jgi:hypothetical protein
MKTQHKTSVAEYLPKVRHHVRIAEKYERLARCTKNSRKRLIYNKEALRQRRICKNIVHVWSAQIAWNKANWGIVLDKLLGSIPPEAGVRVNNWLAKKRFDSRIKEDAIKARTYNFQEPSQVALLS